MKRRDFLKSATGSASLMYLNPVSAKISCPPVLSGASGAPLCPAAAGAEEDWQSRISRPGVVWYHNFASEAEVTRFRWAGSLGNDTEPAEGWQGNGLYITDDGVTGGGCLQLTVPTGGTTSTSWARPFSPLTGATNGRGTDDPGAGVTLQEWNVRGSISSPYDYLGKWKHGTYSHRDYWDHARNAGNGYVCDGDEFYIQFRVKMSSSRSTSGNPQGKLAFITMCGNGRSHVTPNQELVVQSIDDGLVTCYTNFGRKYHSELYEVQGDSSTNRKPGSDFTNCIVPNEIGAANCGGFAFDQWNTVLIHVKAGHDGGGGNLPPIAGNPNNDTQFRMWVAGPGETSYTTHYDKDDYVWSFGEFDSTPLGWSCFQPSAFMNRVDAVEGWYHRYDEIIFSKEFIPCPQV